MDERLELREELNTAENTKQYSAFLEEMNTLKKTRGETDDLALAELARSRTSMPI